MPPRLHAFGIALSSFATIAVAFAQPGNNEPIVMQAPIHRMQFFTVSRVDPDGTILLRPANGVTDLLRDNLASTFAEGHYLLLTTDSKQASRHRLLRAQVIDVGEGSVFTIKTGARAAARVHESDLATLVRPSPVTTARLRALPEEILIESAPPDESQQINAREIAARRISTNNLKQIALAMHNFHASFDQFPPAVIYGPEGKPWHSWRVLILPYLDRADLYNTYDFSQPWDSPRNKALIDQMPSVYRDPIHGQARDTYTNYAAVVGPGAIFRPEGAKQIDPKTPPLGNGGVGVRDIVDGTSNTLMVAPVEPGRKIPWTKPEDIEVGPAFSGFGQPKGIAAPYTFLGPGGGKAAPVVFADGSVRMIGGSVNRLVLDALITCAGGEVIAAEGFPLEPVPGGASDKRWTLKIRVRDRKTTAVIDVEDVMSAPQPKRAVREFRKAF
jgi:Protein of unknown function (DUF1559)